MSCKTEQQLDTCRHWIAYVFTLPEDIEAANAIVTERKRQLEFTYCKVHIMD